MVIITSTAQEEPQTNKENDITHSQFTALAELVRLRENSAARHAAMLVLVDGMTQADAAREAGTGPQNVNRVVKTCLRGMELALGVVARRIEGEE